MQLHQHAPACQDVDMLQYIEHKDLSFPQERGGALVKGFLKKVLAECAEPAAAAPVKQAAPAGIALTEGLSLMRLGCSVCARARADRYNVEAAESGQAGPEVGKLTIVLGRLQ